MYLIIKSRSIYHQGDERSRTNPGHGYPAYTEEVSDNTFIQDYVTLVKEVTSLVKRNTVFKVYQIQELSVTQETKVNIL